MILLIYILSILTIVMELLVLLYHLIILEEIVQGGIGNLHMIII